MRTLLHRGGTFIKVWWTVIEAEDSEGQRFFFNHLNEALNHIEGRAETPVTTYPFTPGNELSRRIAFWSALADRPLPAHIVASLDNGVVRLTNSNSGRTVLAHDWGEFEMYVGSL